MTTERTWGDPSWNTYAKRFIRLVAVDELRVKLHKDLGPRVEPLLRDLSMTDLVVEELEGYPAHQDGLGLTVKLTPHRPELVTDAMTRYGWVPDGENAFRWPLSLAETLALGDGGHEEPDAPSAPQIAAYGPEDDGWYSGLPGSRSLSADGGQIGRDVLFLQAYLVTPRTGVYDPDTMAAVAAFKGRRGLPQDGEVDTEVWRQFIPRLRRNIFPGDTGRLVRILASAMIAGGHLPVDCPVFHSYRVSHQRHVREMQTLMSFPRSGRVTGLEWSKLLAYPWGG